MEARNLKIDIKLKPNAQIPTKGTIGSAGYDLHAYLPDGDAIVLERGQRKLIPTGIMITIQPGFYGRIAPRSGLAFRNGIDVLGGVCDADFRNEIGVILLNSGQENFVIRPGDRIAQIIFESCFDATMNVVSELQATTRVGGFGSTGIS